MHFCKNLFNVQSKTDPEDLINCFSYLWHEWSFRENVSAWKLQMLSLKVCTININKSQSRSKAAIWILNPYDHFVFNNASLRSRCTKLQCPFKENSLNCVRVRLAPPSICVQPASFAPPTKFQSMDEIRWIEILSKAEEYIKNFQDCIDICCTI